MNDYIAGLARLLAEKINSIVDLPFFSEEDEQVFFELVLSKALEIILELALGNQGEAEAGAEG